MTETAWVLLTLVIGTVALVAMASFSASFIVYYRRRRRQHEREKAALAESYIRELLQAQIETQNQTLRQVGEDLHDHIGQLLAVVKMQLSGLDEDLADTPHHQTLAPMLDLLRTTMQEIRQLSRTLDTDAVHRAGLHASLTLELERIERTGRYQTGLHVAGTPCPLGAQTETMLFRMAQEALQNAIKHARAQQLMVSIGYAASRFSLTISDNGRGFDPDAVMPDGNLAGSGLHNLRRRATLLGGTCHITSQPGGGTQVVIEVPRGTGHTE